jgi:N-acetylglutamate synthase-like GNAT family acetyltransferase
MTQEKEIVKSVPTAAEMEFLEDRIYEHNSAQTGQDDGQLFSFILRDEQQEITAGLTGWTWAKVCEIRILWVHAALRGQGHGSKLLAAAEKEARSRGCKTIFLTSYSFQAPGFYQKHGYQLEWQLRDFPPGHQSCFLVKRLDE